ncbi:MAG: hypothetical protein Kow0025_09830 [Thermodesulfovibrionales bacterium]
MEIFRKITPAMYGAIVICFFLPFVNVSCSGQKVMSFTGFQMVTGSTYQTPSMYGEKTKSEKIDPEPPAIAAFVLAIAGLALSLTRSKKGSLFSSAASFGGLVALLWLKADLDNDALKSGQGIIQLEYSMGYWLSVILFGASVFVNGLLSAQKGAPPKPDSAPG